MGLAGGGERLVDPEVQLDIAEAEPRTAPCLQRRWLGNLFESEQIEIERPGCGLAAGRDGDLNVIDSFQRIPRITATTLPISSTPSVNTIGSRAGFSGWRITAPSLRWRRLTVASSPSMSAATISPSSASG